MINTTNVFAAGAEREQLAVAMKMRPGPATAHAAGGYAHAGELARRRAGGLGDAVRGRRDAAALAVRPAPPRPFGLAGRRARGITPLRVHKARH
jgi:hypothetical protein